MKRMLLLTLLGMTILSACGDDGRYGMTLINQGDHTIRTDQVVISDFGLIGGTVVVEEEASVNGSIYLFGGELIINGVVEGDVAALGGSTVLGSNAEIHGDFYAAGGDVQSSTNAVIRGEETALTSQELADARAPRSVAGFLWQLFSTTMLLGAAAWFAVKLMPTLTRRLSTTSTEFPVISGALGLLLLLVLPMLLVFMAFTIVLIPATIAGFITIVILIGYGIIGLGRGLGERISHWTGWQISSALQAALGTGLLTIVLNLAGLIPFIGEIMFAISGAVGIGSVVLSGFGRRVYEPPEYDRELETV